MKAHRAYERQLPGTGFVAIDVTRVPSMLWGGSYQGTLLVERRASVRRTGHSPPVIAKASGKSIGAVVQQLLPTAQHNWAIGAALWRQNRSGRGRRSMAR